MGKTVTEGETVKRILLSILTALLYSLPGAASAQPDFSAAIKIGSGATMVIEYTDPDCPFCRRGSEFFRTRTDVTRYVFLDPLPMHPEAKVKAQYILSSGDRVKAYEEVMAGKLDGKMPKGITAEGERLAEVHLAAAAAAKVDSTPTFVICGRIIEGFDQEKLEMVLGR